VRLPRRLWARIVLALLLLALLVVEYELRREDRYYECILEHVSGSMSSAAVEVVSQACAKRTGWYPAIVVAKGRGVEEVLDEQLDRVVHRLDDISGAIEGLRER
jgi:hypothetical protein